MNQPSCRNPITAAGLSVYGNAMVGLRPLELMPGARAQVLQFADVPQSLGSVTKAP